jgi:hypothetical protein
MLTADFAPTSGRNFTRDPLRGRVCATQSCRMNEHVITFTGLYAGSDGSQIAVELAETTLFADWEGEPDFAMGAPVAVSAVRLDDHGWFRAVHLGPVASAHAAHGEPRHGVEHPRPDPTGAGRTPNPRD